MEKLELQKIANEVRKDIVTALHSAKAGHPGGSLSAADVFTYLYFEEMNIDPKDPKKADRALLCAGLDGCVAAGTGRPRTAPFRPSGLSRSRCTTGSCCTSG